jgi:hypothetical protein
VLIKAPFIFFYEDEFEHRKSEFAKRNYDTVFIGSSRTRLAVIPAYFDALTESETTTYNLGTEGALPPQTFDWCEDLIESKSSLKHIFFELSGGIDQIPIYEEPWKRFSFAEYARTLNLIDFRKLAVYHDQRALGLFKSHLSGSHEDYNVPLKNLSGKKELTPKKATTPEVLEFSRKLNLQIENGDLSEFPLHAYYWERVCRLIELAEAKQIKIYFFISPRLETRSELVMVAPIYQRLDEKYKFRTDHYDESLYLENTSTDEFHLNYNGALRFTELLADTFYKRNF